MLINFALGVVDTKVTSDKVSTDGHECSNLISDNWQLRRKGFLAEHFIKPPVNITFEFPCHICIHYVFVTPCVGQQQSSHIELYSASKLLPRALNRLHKPDSSFLSVGVSSKSEGLVSAGASGVTSHSSPHIFYPVSKISVTDGERICFHNPKVCDINSSDTANTVSNQCRVEIRNFRSEIIAASSHLTLRIVRTVRGSTAAVSNIEIWGLPALSVPSAIKDDIISKYISFINQSSVVKNTDTPAHKVSDTATPLIDASSVSEKIELEIPEDFIDPLTCEVMAIPMLLPSGKNVDLSTLDRYFNSEASYGRQPKDPFTGLQFSNTSKPIPNGALKARIDQFLMKHSNDTATSAIPRTVRAGSSLAVLGKRNKSGNSCDEVSSLISQNLKRQLLHTQTKDSLSENHEQKDSSLSRCQESKSVSQTIDQSDKRIHASSIKVSLGALEGQETIVSSSNSCRNDDSSDHSHESLLKSSLNNALASVLGCLPSYLTNVQSSSDIDLCSVCKKTLSRDTSSYLIPCQHYVCRRCLTVSSSESSLKCGICEFSCSKSDVLRRHQTM